MKNLSGLLSGIGLLLLGLLFIYLGIVEDQELIGRLFLLLYGAIAFGVGLYMVFNLNKEDEKPLIAGVYMNRYSRGWKLEADPTLIYAAQDFSIQRVLNVHKKIDSPYNTYMYAGLPPGPICVPSISSLNAVLDYEKHNYMFFCAKDDFSGYHSFARTYNQHLINARKFQRELNRRNIRS